MIFLFLQMFKNRFIKNHHKILLIRMKSFSIQMHCVLGAYNTNFLVNSSEYWLSTLSFASTMISTWAVSSRCSLGSFTSKWVIIMLFGDLRREELTVYKGPPRGYGNLHGRWRMRNHPEELIWIRPFQLGRTTCSK